MDGEAEFKTAQAVESEMWEVTNQLRFCRRVEGNRIAHILQQKWVTKTGNSRWIDVPVENW